ncbi:Sak4-like ssDNA annealing protein [Mycobacterium phage Konstantine]|uniref:AAA-ATPase n=1 Tax=Mycobacterium phage Konstantine TaxID=563121 RepID=B5U546_9CAUD|nr:Sak4-like ssDNA annealing protein [Mycobacterium phage Konstantine]ACI12492.1 hypothetical protein KONSTANTINE_76 [Mycobacterium phage Konstantine]
MGLKDKVKKLADADEYLNMLVYADSGTGKTVLAGSDDSVLFAAPEDDGLLSAKRMGSRAEKYDINGWEDLMELHKDLMELVEEGEPIPYKWLAIDSITEMQAMCMRYILAKGKAENPDKDPDVPQIQDWQRYYILFEKMVRAFNDLPVNVIWTALARKVEDADGNEFMVPEIQGKDYGIAMKTVSYMTVYGYMMREVVEKEKVDPETGETKKVKVRSRVIYFEDNGVYRGKDRTLALGAKFVLPPKNGLKAIREAIENYGQDKPAKAAAPAKKAPAKKAAKKAAPAEPAKVANPANTPDDAADLSDSVPQYDGEPAISDPGGPHKTSEGFSDTSADDEDMLSDEASSDDESLDLAGVEA